MLIKKSSHTRAFAVPSEYFELEKRVDALVEKVYQSAVKELSDNDDGKDRVRLALANRFKPYILEAEIIAQQLLSAQYDEFKQETREFFGALVNVVACPDGRISVLSLTDPRAAYVHRFLRGQVPTRLTTSRKEVPIPASTELRAGVWTNFKKMHRKYPDRKPRLVALVGPHIDSFHPSHGCGAAAAALSGMGSGLPAALATMRWGGARNYFRLLCHTGEFYALDHFAAIAGGVGTTIDYVHDIYSQGVIVGLAHAWKELTEKETLRDNLVRLHRAGKIVASEFLVSGFREKILRLSERKRLNYRDPLTFAENALAVGRMARKLTREEEARSYPILPAYLKNRLDEVAARVTAYHILRSVVYMVLGNIVPGKHWLIHHPEQLLRVGPIGADFNVNTIAFIETTPPTFSQADVASAFALYGLMERFLPALDVDLTREARVVMVTGGFNPGIYRDEATVEAEYDRLLTTVLDDAAGIKVMLKRAVTDGAAVVIPMIHHTGNRSIIDVV